MAIFHMSAQTISRGKGHSAVKAAAYRHGAKFTSDFTGEVHDFTKKQNVDDTIILLPDGADQRFLKPEYLWNAVDKSEKRIDAQVAKEFNVALPTELNNDEKKALAIEFCQEHFTKKGMIADIAFHKLDSDNPHFHVMLTTRKLKDDGINFESKKERSWNEKELINDCRAGFADMTNRHLEKAGVSARVDHRSLADQLEELQAIENPTAEQQAKMIALDRKPTIHLGHSKNPERMTRYNESQEVKVSQEAKADIFLKGTLSGQPVASPTPSPAASIEDALKGAMDKTAGAISKMASPINSTSTSGSEAPAAAQKPEQAEKNEYQKYEAPEREKKPGESKKGGEKSGSGGGGHRGDGGAKSLSDHRDSHDKNLHLTEAQREELEELEAEEEKARKAYITKGVDLPESEPEPNKPRSLTMNKSSEERHSSFKSKFKSTFNQHKSFTEMQFEEERKRYENKGHPKYK